MVIRLVQEGGGRVIKGAQGGGKVIRAEDEHLHEPKNRQWRGQEWEEGEDSSFRASVHGPNNEKCCHKIEALV